MELKLGDVLNLNHVLKLIIDDENKKIDPVLKFRLLGIMKSFENHITNFEIIKNEKIIEYGRENNDGNIEISQADKESIKKLNDALTPIIKSDVEINISKLKAVEVFNKGLSADYLMGLYPIIEE